MYTVFTGNEPKRNRIGLVIFVRTLAVAKQHCEPGDRIIGWSNAGNARATWTCESDGRFTRKAGR